MKKTNNTHEKTHHEHEKNQSHLNESYLKPFEWIQIFVLFSDVLSIHLKRIRVVVEVKD
jgi:hypothetical protein